MQFITLTYSDDNLVYGDSGASLNKRDLQLFFKRLRKAQPAKKISYYAVGEYGGSTGRPHYHILLYGSNIMLESVWKLGQVHYGELNIKTIYYSLKYMQKGLGNTKNNKKNLGKQPEFSLMSKGIGANYITEKMLAWHYDDLDNRMYVNLYEQKLGMPRYYKDKIYLDGDRRQIGERMRREQSIRYEALDCYYLSELHELHEQLKLKNVNKSL